MATSPSSENHAHKILAFAVISLAVIAVAWFIFAPKPEDHASEPSGSTTTGPAADGSTYSSQDFAFSVNVPDGFSVDESYVNQDLGPGREIPGIAFKIPESMAQGTNLSRDSRVSVEMLSDIQCVPGDFLYDSGSSSVATLGNNQFVTATSAGAGAGNLYEERVYIAKNASRCYAVRYFIHSTQIANYPAGTVTAFDKAALLRIFDTFPASLRLI
ncbi:MAG TPA: hypothetical protein VHD69_02225 [Candidatus Paceibacterota bacterium]|nr:hypothetical protein [Candidatus Paceibacterota bacterium]